MFNNSDHNRIIFSNTLHT